MDAVSWAQKDLARPLYIRGPLVTDVPVVPMGEPGLSAYITYQQSLGLAVRINVTGNQLYQVPIGYKVAEILVTYGGVTGGSIKISPFSGFSSEGLNAQILGVVYEPTIAGKVEGFGGLAGKAGAGVTNKDFDRPELAVAKPIYEWARDSVNAGLPRIEILEGIRSRIMDLGIAYGYSDSLNNNGLNSPREVLERWFMLDPDGRLVNTSWDCDQTAYVLAVIAEAAGMEVYMPEGFLQHPGTGWGGYDSNAHQIVIYKSEGGAFYAFDGTLPPRENETYVQPPLDKPDILAITSTPSATFVPTSTPYPTPTPTFTPSPEPSATPSITPVASSDIQQTPTPSNLHEDENPKIVENSNQDMAKVLLGAGLVVMAATAGGELMRRRIAKWQRKTEKMMGVEKKTEQPEISTGAPTIVQYRPVAGSADIRSVEVVFQILGCLRDLYDVPETTALMGSAQAYATQLARDTLEMAVEGKISGLPILSETVRQRIIEEERQLLESGNKLPEWMGDSQQRHRVINGGEEVLAQMRRLRREERYRGLTETQKSRVEQTYHILAQMVRGAKLVSEAQDS